MVLDHCQLVYVYRMACRRIEILDPKIEKIKRWTDMSMSNIRWVQELACFEHEKKKLQELLSLVEESLFNYSQ